MAYPDNYVNIDLANNLCFDSCHLQYNYGELSFTKDSSKFAVGSVANSEVQFGGNDYELENVYLLNSANLIHTYAAGTDVIGELLIEHKIVDGENKLYIVLPIRNTDGSETDQTTTLNNLVTGSNLTFDLNTLMTPNPYNHYQSDIDNWIVYDPFETSLTIDEINFPITNTEEDQFPSPAGYDANIQGVLSHHDIGATLNIKKQNVTCRRIQESKEEDESVKSMPLQFVENPYLNVLILLAILISPFVLVGFIWPLISSIFSKISNSIKGKKSDT